jgi:hypothetical protein
MLFNSGSQNGMCLCVAKCAFSLSIVWCRVNIVDEWINFAVDDDREDFLSLVHFSQIHLRYHSQYCMLLSIRSIHEQKRERKSINNNVEECERVKFSFKSDAYIWRRFVNQSFSEASTISYFYHLLNMHNISLNLLP